MTSSSAASQVPPVEAPPATLHEIRLAGRGGQGVVTAGELLGRAAVLEGSYSQSIPTFGPERRGALSQCTLRIADREIRLKCSAASPGYLLVLDPTIWHHANVLLGILERGVLIFNSPRPPEEIAAELREGRYGYRPAAEHLTVFTVDATGIALEIIRRPITSTAMMGALVGATGLVQMSSVAQVLQDRFGERGEANVAAAREAAARLQRTGD